MALNAGPVFKFNEAISFFVGCDTQQEIDELWEKLTADGGSPSRCGWLKDKYGLSWQIVPNTLGADAGRQGRRQVGAGMNAMLQMDKLDLKRCSRRSTGSSGSRGSRLRRGGLLLSTAVFAGRGLLLPSRSSAHASSRAPRRFGPRGLRSPAGRRPPAASR